MADALELHQGEEKIFTVAIDEDGIPLDLTGFTLSVEIWWRGRKRFTLRTTGAVDGDGASFDPTAAIEILDLSPATPGAGENMPAQYQFRLTELVSATFPLGRIVQVYQVRVSAGLVTTRRGPEFLKVLRP